ncbi:MAG: serine/threonine protein kinase [Planctomycetes bacterium]|nr:serine/threonine protein kinase [Planctomycetota bacterium]
MPDAGPNQSEPQLADLSGRQLGDYRLLRRLGRGAMAEVYLAEQGSLTRQVAVKVLKRELATDQTYIQRFQREARAAAALVHANIVQIHEVGCIDGVHFIAQEYVQGLNLHQWVARDGALDLRTALVIMRQVAAALSKAGDQAIVHRDIKPENIMITRSGEVKVADFGLARVPGSGDSVHLTQAGMTLGTPLYMSPEQVEGKSLDPRSDLYSFGVTCYHMLAGSPPFEGDTALAVAVQHLNKSPESLENARSDLPPALCRIVHKMLAKAPENRYQSARELLRELRQLQLEHLDEEWPDDLPGWDSADLETAGISLHETTQQLDALMKDAARTHSGRPLWVLWAVGILTAFFLGSVLAFFTTRESPLLAQTGDGPPSVPEYETVGSQWAYAMHVDTEEGWQAVIDRFPDTAYWVNRAKKQLAWLHLQHDDFVRAMEIFKELAFLDESQPELRAFGLAGQYWLLTRPAEHDDATTAAEKHREAAAVLSDLLSVLSQGGDSGPGRRRLSDPLTGQLVMHALENAPGATTNREIQQLLRQLDQESSQGD